MQYAETIRRSRQILQQAGIAESPLTQVNFLDFADNVKQAILALPPVQREQHLDLAKSLRRLRDEFDQAVTADPLILYRPQHAVSEAFHRSPALIRFFRTGNRCSKTISCIYEMYCSLTGQHPYQKTPPLPMQAFVVGLNYTQYATTVFEPKYITGEPGNSLSPVFPETGKWFHSYDEKKHVLTIACPSCADAGHARSCRHPKSRLVLFSDQAGPGVMAGGQYGRGHLDEEVDRGFFIEGRERLKTVPLSRMLVSLTPTKGETFWTEQDLVPVAERGDKVPGTSTPIVELFTIDQFSAGLTDHAGILASMATMSEADIQSRIFGIPATASEFAVFDLTTLREMSSQQEQGARGVLTLKREKEDAKLTDAEILGKAAEQLKPEFKKREDGWLTVWRKPHPLGQYVIGADVAQGLTGRDQSVADVLRMHPFGLDMNFEQVAQHASYLDPVLYAEELFKLGLLYAPCSLVIERNGPGLVVIRRLIELGCWFMYQDVNQIAAVQSDFATQYGLETNVRTKSVVISLMQSVLRLNKTGREALVLRSADSLREFRSYVQKPTDTGKTLKFEADGMEHDDRVMAPALAIYAARTSPLYDLELEKRLKAAMTSSTDKLDDYSRKFWRKFHEEEEARAKMLRGVQREFEAEFDTEDFGDG